MEEMRGAAMAYYANMLNDQQQMVQSFYESMDTNGDGQVSVQEYLDFLEQNGFSRRCMPPNFFKLLDENNDGTLDFEECVTLFYMLTGHRRVICDGCQSYLWGLYFLCVDCYNVVEGNTYDLCCSCYRNKNFSHAHSSFLDNYALLRINQSKVTYICSEETSASQVKTSKESVSKREKVKKAIAIATQGVQTVNAVSSIAHAATKVPKIAKDVSEIAKVIDPDCTIM